MSRRQRIARGKRLEATQAGPPRPPPPPPIAPVKVPMTAPQLVYAGALWLLWVASVTWALALMVYSFDAPRGELLADPPYDSTLVKYVAFTAMGVLTVRLMFHTGAMIGLMLVLTIPISAVFTSHLHNSIEAFDQKKRRLLYTTRVALIGKHVWETRKGANYKKILDNPLDQTTSIQFWPELVPGKVGDMACVDVYVGQLGGLWALPSDKCGPIP